MLFTHPLFLFYFLPVSLILHRLAIGRNSSAAYPVRASYVLILCTLVFYGFKEVWWLIPFVGSVFFDFVWATLLAREERPKWRKAYCLMSVAQNLALLTLFKYRAFFLGLI